ncbi:hypothetical protein [Reyranella sp.]|uniref:hypothetical protein n=1 Tax=Reyranella sp. TaxID=1929291 RepID=UPI0025FCC7FB|nr:hypothetical protein [Reyranella sp.]
MSLLPPVVAGAVFVVPHPFCWEMASKPGDDPEGPYSIEIMSWRPGVRPELRGHGEYHYTVEEYEGMGSQILTVVGVFRPGKYPTRVFYTRRWRDPDGKEFGKGGLRIKVMSAFKRIIGGYRHHEEPCLMAREATSVGEANTTTKELTDG